MKKICKSLYIQDHQITRGCQNYKNNQRDKNFLQRRVDHGRYNMRITRAFYNIEPNQVILH